jgi:5-methylcytosine-specific restriction protein A
MPKAPAIYKTLPVTDRTRRALHDRTRPSSSARGYDRAWSRVRLVQLARAPLCKCGAVAVEVDHVVPLADGGARLELGNLQSLCKPCHTAKTNAERSRAR